VQKWEYKILDFGRVFYSNNADESITMLLNELGQDGWELIGLATRNIHMFVLKRPIELSANSKAADYESVYHVCRS
jgi:hypothetical protein